MAEQTTSAQSAGEARRPADGPDPRAELARNREEILRLRDLLIAKDAEIGVLKGRLAQLEAGTARLLNAVNRVRALFPGFAWRAASRLVRRFLGPA